MTYDSPTSEVRVVIMGDARDVYYCCGDCHSRLWQQGSMLWYCPCGGTRFYVVDRPRASAITTHVLAR